MSALLVHRVRRGNLVRGYATESDGVLAIGVQHGREFLPFRVAVFAGLTHGLVYRRGLLRHTAKIVSDANAVGSWSDLLH
jgi:hypothetical protein